MKIWWSCELPMSGSIGFFDCRWEISSLFIPTPLVSGWEWTTNSDKNISLISYLGWNLQLVIFNMSTAVLYIYIYIVHPSGQGCLRFLCPRILEWAAISFSRGSSLPRNGTWISCTSCIGRWILYTVSPGNPIQPGKPNRELKLKTWCRML